VRRNAQAEQVFACGIKQDELIPSHELQNFADLLSSGRADGGSSSVVYDEMSSLYGHDAFFKELSWLGPRLKQLVEGGLESELQTEEQMKPMLAI
jgi:homoserine acetyltransferase